MLNWIAIWIGVFLFGLGGPLQNSTQEFVPISNDVVEGAKLPVFWGDPLLQGLHVGLLHRDRRARRLLADPQPDDARLRRQGGRLQPGGGALRRHQRVPRTTSSRWRSPAPSRASPARSTSSAGSSGLRRATCRGCDDRVRRHRRRPPRAQHRGRRRARGAALRRAPHRHVDTEPRSRDLQARTGVEPDPADPGPRRAVRRRRHDRALADGARAKERGRHDLDRPPGRCTRRPEASAPSRGSASRSASSGAWVALPPITARSWVWSLVLCLDRRHARHRRAHPRRATVRRLRDRVRRARLRARLLGHALEPRQARDRRRLVGAVRRHAPLRDAAHLRGARRACSASAPASSNIGLEGMMLMGAFFGILGADKLDSWWLGLIVAILAGGLMALLHAVLVDSPARGPDRRRHRDQLPRPRPHRLPVHRHLRRGGHADRHPGHPAGQPRLPGRHSRPGVPRGGLRPHEPDDLGRDHPDPGLAGSILFKTPLGLRIRAVGEHPRAADTVGISVYGIRYGAVVLSGMLAAAGGAYLSIGFVELVQREHDGRARVHRARGGDLRQLAPVRGAAAACLLFGFSSALAQRLPEYSDSAAVLFQALPYVLTLIAVAGVIGRSIPPAAVGRPYKKS